MWDCIFLLLCNGNVRDGQKSPSLKQRGKLLLTTARQVFTLCVLVCQGHISPLLRERFKLQPLLFEGKLKALDLKLALPAAFQAAHQLLLCSWCGAGMSRLQKSPMPWGPAPTASRHAQGEQVGNGMCWARDRRAHHALESYSFPGNVCTHQARGHVGSNASGHS